MAIHNIHRAIGSFSKVMKAIRILKYGGPEVLQVVNVPIPSPAENEVLIRVRSSGINPVDTYMREGKHALSPTLPSILGRDVAGVVEEVGNSVTKFKKGDRVFAGLPNNGGYAEYATSEEKNVYPLSEKLTFNQGAAIYIPYFTAYRALVTKCRAKAGENVLIHGASGAVGNAAIQIAKKEKGYLNNAVAAIGCLGFDVVLENLANVNLSSDFSVLNNNGRIAVVGSRGTVEVNPRSLMITEGVVYGINMPISTEQELSEMGAAIVKGIEEGWVSPVVAREYELEEAAQAHHDIIHNTGTLGKLVFKL
ncbi:unnamed protein product [Timema podura]|uniref:Enoyl reductase (ER) domain-containing protein n=1 Tax=Timema podura TaxID=61482 RepID=A0ABN7NRP4_TIMPD|nr:unnamed protein product [Timema podura]